MNIRLRHLLILLLALQYYIGQAQDADEVARPVTNVLQLQVGQAKVRDTYLTPQLYTGINFGLRYERWHAWRDARWSSQKIMSAQFAMPSDRGQHGKLWAGRFGYRYAAHYRMNHVLWEPLTLMAGGFAGMEAGFDYNLKLAGSNNPATAKATINTGVSLAGVWHYQWFGQDCSAMLQMQMPLMGFALQPEYGASYYESFYLNTADNKYHFTTLDNRQDLEVRLTTDVALSVIPAFRQSGSLVRVGLGYHIETMDINDVVSRFSSFDFVLGFVFDHIKYNRQKSNLLKRPAHEAY